MRKNMCLAGFLALLMTFSCVACGEKGNAGTGQLPSPSNPSDDRQTHYVDGMLHKVSYDYEQGKPFIVNGETEYKIVVSDAAGVAKAATYMLSQISVATGVALDIVGADSVVYDSTAHYVVIGGEELFKAAGLSMPSDDIGSTGYYVKTKDNSVFIQANGAEGYQLGTLAFLRAVIGYDMLGSDAYIYERDGSVLPQMDLIERPDYDFRNGNDTANRFGMGFTDNIVLIPVNGKQWHNTFQYLPPEIYAEDNSEWYSDRTIFDGATSETPGYGQLCYTAHGDETKWNEMVYTLFEKVKAYVDARPDLNNITITQEDSPVACLCQACTDEKERYNGSNAAAVIKVINAVDDLLQAALEEDAKESGKPKREIYISFFAYRATVQSPTVKNADGTYSTIDGLKCNPNVSVFLAPITASYSYTFYEEKNKEHAENVKSWSAVCDRIYMWLYETNFGHYFYPLATWYDSVETYRFCKDANAMYMYSQTQYDNPTRTAFSFVKDYINSKVLFDLNTNVTDVIDKYFENYFLAAEEPMREMFEEIQVWCDYLVDAYPVELTGGYKDDINSPKYWPKRLIDGWMDLIDEAYREIEEYKTSNLALYETVYKRIQIESIFPRYVLLSLYGGYFKADELMKEKSKFKEDCINLGFTHYNEHNDGVLELLWSEWGV